MPATYKDNGGSVNGSNKVFTYDFPVLQTEDVKVALDGVTQATTKYAVSLSPANITFNNTSIDTSVQESDGAPKTGVTVRVFRYTTVGKTDGNEDPKAVFASGNAIRSGDLNANFEQALFGIHELQEQPFISDELEKPIVFNDNEKAIFGTGRDAEIYHGGTNTRFKNDTGDLVISCGSDDIRLAAKDDIYLEVNATDSGATSTENGIIVHGNGAVKLYFDNSEKVRTRAEGAIIFGVLQADGIEVHDNEEIKVGLGGDLKFKHNGTHSSIENITGDLNITCSGDDIDITAADDIHIRPQGGEEGIIVIGNGSVELYHNNVKKLETTSTGATVTGSLTADEIKLGDNEKILVGDSDDIEIFHNGTDSYIKNNTNTLFIQSGGNVVIENSSGENYVRSVANGAVELYYDNSLRIQTTALGTNLIGDLYFDNSVNAGKDLFWDQSLDYLKFTDNVKAVFGNGTDLQIWHDTSDSYIRDTGTGSLYIDSNQLKVNNAVSDETMAIFNENGAVELFYDNAKKFETRSDGVEIYDHLYMDDNHTIVLGDDSDMQLYHTGTHGHIYNKTGWGILRSDNWQITDKESEDVMANFKHDGAVELFHDNSKKLETTSAGATVTGVANATTGFQVNGTALNLAHLANVHDATPSDGQVLKWINSNSRWEPAQDSGAGGASLSDGDYGDITVSSSGSSFTIDKPLDFDDNEKARFGTDNDFEIYHDNSHGYVSNLKGHLCLYAEDSVLIRNQSSDGSTTENLGLFFENGAVELFYDNVKKFETTANGITVGSHVWTTGGDYTLGNNMYVGDGGRIGFGADEDLKIYHNGSDSYIDDSGTGALTIRGSATYIQNYGTEMCAKFMADGAVELYYDGTKRFETGPGYNLSTGDISPSASGTYNLGGTSAKWNNAYFAGNVYLYDNDKLLLGDDGDLEIKHDGSNSYISDTGTGELYIQGSTFVAIRDSVDGDTLGKFIKDGAVELYYNNISHMKTTGEGIDVHNVDDAVLTITTTGTDAHDDARLELITQESAFKIQNDRSLGTDGGLTFKAESENGITILKDGAVELSYDGVERLETNSSGIGVVKQLLCFSDSDKDEGEIKINARGVAEDNDMIWIGTRDTNASNYRFAVDGSGQITGNDHIKAGLQRNNAANWTGHYNSADRIRHISYRGTSDNANYRARAHFGTASSDWDDYRVFYYVDAQDDVAVDYDQDQTLAMSGSGRIQGKHHIWAGRVESDEATPNSVYAGGERSIAAYADDSTDYTYIHSRNVADAQFIFQSAVNNEPNVEIEADGSARTDGTWSDSNADYAECFEWTDGNTSDQERRGMTVVLDGEKIKLATDSDNKDNIIGVVSAEPVVLGDAAPLGWHGRYKKDAYGSPIRKEQEWLVWRKEYTYVDGVKTLCAQPDPSKPQTLNRDIERVRVENIERDKAKGLIPDFAITNNIRYKTYGKDIDTTTYDPTKAYIPRKDRKEWDAIGMVGKLVVRRGQPVGTRWLLMKENIGTDTDGTVLDRYLVR